MKNNLSYFTLIESPLGYGKTFFIENIINSPQNKDYLFIKYIHQNDDFINCLIQSFHLKNISSPLSENLIEWYKFFEKNNQKIVIIFDDIDLIQDKKIFDFIDFFIKNKNKNLSLIISSSSKLVLNKSVLIKDFQWINKDDLAFNPKSLKKLWQDNSLEIKIKDIEFLNYSKGWSQAINLYLSYIKGDISKQKFDYLLKESILSLFSAINIDSVFSNSYNSELEKNLLEREDWSELILDFLSRFSQKNFQYWVYLAIKNNTEIDTSINYLERALSLSFSKVSEDELNKDIKLYIYDRLIYFYSINCQYHKVDEIFEVTENYFSEIESFFLDSNHKRYSSDIVHYYMKANRLRQKSMYSQALEYIEKIQKNVIYFTSKFQTKSYILKGLIYYQIGEYKNTREYYQRAIYLAKAEKNYTLEIEITIMLAFLNVWEGKNIDILPTNIIEIIDNFPIKEQPLMWLNLAFYWILGEKIDIESVELILNKIEIINYKLKYKYLIPLIADIKARMLRYKGDYENAFYEHKIAIDNLSNNSFEYIHAQLNMSLTLIKVNNLESAIIILKEVYSLALKSSSLGLLKESEILLKQIDSSFINEKSIVIQNENSNNNLSYIQIESFGGFNIKVNGKDNIKWSRKRAKNLFIHLLFNNRGIHRESLAEILFPDDMQPLKNLDVHIHFIRKIFDNSKDRENSIIIFKNSCYFLNKNFNYVFDIDIFESTFNKWLKTDDLKLKLLLSEQMINLYQGEFLPEIDFADNWQSERENYRKRIIEIINYLIKNSDKEISEIYEKLLLIEPLLEENYIKFMKYSYQNKALVKNIYKRCLNVFKNELGLESSNALSDVYNELIKK